MRIKKLFTTPLLVFLFSLSEAQEPTLFLKDLMSKKVEYGATITPDSKTVYFVKTDSFYISKPKIIYKTNNINSVWSIPIKVNFSGKYSDSSPFVTPDGKRLFFTSKRPKENETVENNNIWYVDLVDGKEGKPVCLNIVNSKKSEYSPSLDNQGNLYFGSNRDGGYGMGDLWYSEFKNGKYQKPINLGRLINTPNGEWGSCISADGQLLIFENSGNKQNYSDAGDLHISQKINGTWQKPLHLPQPINSVGSDLTPKFHNGFLYYASNRNYDHLGNLDLNNVNLYSLSITNILHRIKN